MTTVVTVLRSGGDYGPKWVHALKAGLEEHLPGHRFVCLTDVDVKDVEMISLEHGWPGWWSKVELFRLDFPAIYMDLDTLPVGDLSDIASYGDDLAVLSDFYRPDKAASGVMAWTPGEHTERIYREFCKDPGGVMAAHRTRSDYWYRKVWDDPDRLQDLYPGQLVSFKAHARKGPPEGARLVCFHGRPRPNDPDAGWGYDLWKERAGDV